MRERAGERREKRVKRACNLFAGAPRKIGLLKLLGLVLAELKFNATLSTKFLSFDEY